MASTTRSAFSPASLQQLVLCFYYTPRIRMKPMQVENICSPSRGRSLLGLPVELQAHVVSFLPYPDLLALKLTCTQFSTLVQTKKTHRVDWLLDRAAHGLPVPSKSRCLWSTDEEFVNHNEVKQFLRQRRAHRECYLFADQECYVIPGQVCAPIKQVGSRRNITRRPVVTPSYSSLVSVQPRLMAPYNLALSLPFLAVLGILTAVAVCYIRMDTGQFFSLQLDWL